MASSRIVRSFLITCLVLGATSLPGNDPRPAATAIRAAGITGSLVICGGGELPEEILEKFLDLAGGDKARIVVIPTAHPRVGDGSPERWLTPWRDRGTASIQLLHTRSKDRANETEFVAPLRDATAVWISGGWQARIADAYVDTAVERELAALLERGGVIGGTSAGAAILSRVMISSGDPDPVLRDGFDGLPGAIIDQHFVARDRKARLFEALRRHPGLVGVGVDERTAAIVRGRRLTVAGESTVTLCLAASASRARRDVVLRRGQTADWTAFRRAALARTGDPFPPAEPPTPDVPDGALVIAGGGAPREAFEAFVKLAGGPDAPIVVIPSAVPDPVPTDPRDARLLRNAGARHVRTLHGRTPPDIDRPEFLEPLRRARGVWFSGGRQWRLVDAYAGTPAFELFHDVLRRGGVIGGSSAGASIQADYLVRGNPLGNRDISSEGYERGFAFLPGTAIDQHFAQRNRFADMSSLMKAFPQLVGIGIDERTAIIVRGHVARVVGRHNVAFYSEDRETTDDGTDHDSVGPGEWYDLRRRRALREF